MAEFLPVACAFDSDGEYKARDFQRLVCKCSMRSLERERAFDIDSKLQPVADGLRQLDHEPSTPRLDIFSNHI
jgi:hypothetical protein